jgi:spermidine/putrescine transport system ATP-binding protein
MSEGQIVLENVTKHFSGTVAVEPINFEIKAGEFLAIMGSSGCGKTTTLRMLAGLETPSSGEIRLNGKRMNELKAHERETPLVWQTLALFPFLNVIENVEFGLKMRGVEKPERTERALKWLKRMEIEQFANRSIDQLSGGQRQRVALARALVTEPPVLLLDEPLSALDANLVVRMQSVLTRLQKELGITFIYVTHSQSEAFAMADRVVIMSAGVIEQIGTPREIYRSPASRFVAEFVGTNNIISGHVKERKGHTLICSTAFGTIDSRVGDGNTRHKAGSSVELVISADMIELSQEKTSSENEIQIQFVAEEFTGSVVTLYFEDANKNELIVQKQQREIAPLELSYGSKIYAHWDPKDVFCLPDVKPK